MYLKLGENIKSWGYSSVVQPLPRMFKVWLLALQNKWADKYFKTTHKNDQEILKEK